jgi:hypothetical protein
VQDVTDVLRRGRSLGWPGACGATATLRAYQGRDVKVLFE